MMANYDTIEHLRLRWRGQTSEAYHPATHMRIEKEFAEIELRPPDMPPNAVLLIRSMSGLPSLKNLNALPTEWYQELHQRMNQLFQQAYRPRNGYIPHGANSIIFLDYAEAIAGLTQAVIENRFESEWCWSQLIPQAYYSTSDAMVLAWGRFSQYLPAVFKQLTEVQIVTALERIPDSALDMLIQELRVTFALPQLPTVQLTEQGRHHDFNPSSSRQAPSSDAFLAPWDDWLSSSAYHLSQDRQYFVGQILALAHAPVYARSEAFATQTAQWFANPFNHQASKNRRPILKVQSEQTRRADKASSPSDVDIVRPYHKDKASSQSKPRADSDDSAFVLESDSIPVNHPMAEYVEAEELGLHDNEFRTGLAGTFYLINFMEWLYLPDEWDASLSQHLSAWALLELLARGLLSDDIVDISDPIWQILAKLDEREINTLVGDNFSEKINFRLPVRLFHRIAHETMYWRVALVDDSLHIIDETAHYPIIVEPLEDREPDAVIAALIAEYETDTIRIEWAYGDALPDAPLSAFVESITSPFLQTWLQKMIAFVRSCLHDLADIDPTDLLSMSGRVLLSYTHIDLFQPIEATNIQVRKSGLDRNPGWLPNFGYIILFHFEEG